MAILDGIGKLLAGLWLTIIGIVLLCSFPICGFAASFAVGAGVLILIGGGTLGVIAFFFAAFGFGLFLSVFVWPHAKQAVYGSVDYLGKNRP
jgi:hypothetical protein